MKLALTVWENRVSPLFDSTHMLLIVDIKKRNVIGKHFETFHYESPFTRAAKLANLDINVLICGAISDLFANPIEIYGIRIIPFIAGTVDEVLDAYLMGVLSSPKFRMPGCKSKGEGAFKEAD